MSVFEFVNFLVDEFGWEIAVVIKNFIIGFGLFLVGIFLATWYSSSIGSTIRVDHDHELEKDGIVMVIMKRRDKTIIIVPDKLATREWFFNIFIFTFHKLRLIRGPHITKKNVKQAKYLFTIYVIISIIIVICSTALIFSVMDYKLLVD